jgi:hypothetical protein
MAASMGAVNKRLLNPLSICSVLAACLAVAGPAAADVIPEGTGEPLYTNSTQNTQWFRTTVPSGTDDYRLKVSYYANNALVNEQTVGGAQSGVFWANWSGVASLQHGGQYKICVQGQYSLPNDSLYFSDGPNSCAAGDMLGRRSVTTIDRSKPSAAIEAAGGAATTKSGQIPVSIAFSDDVAGPYPSTWTCIAAGSDPCGQFDYNQKCSAPGSAGKSTTFSCELDASQLPDGPVTVCARSADASVPDNPAGADQSKPASSANLSDASCDTVTLDRSVPPPADGGGTPADPTPADPTPATPAPTSPTPAPAIKGIRIGSLTVAVPKRVKLGKVKQLVLSAHATQAGQMSLRLTRGKKVYSRLSVGLSTGLTKQRLRLPKRLKAGTYTVKIAFKASGAGWAATGTTKISARK